MVRKAWRDKRAGNPPALKLPPLRSIWKPWKQTYQQSRDISHRTTRMLTVPRFLCFRSACVSTVAAASRSIFMAYKLDSDTDMAKASVYDSFRQKYSQEDFGEENLESKEPIGQFDIWFKLACATRMEGEANAAALATSTRYDLYFLLKVCHENFGPLTVYGPRATWALFFILFLLF